jgi:ABC-type antimicrobial peptide transport system permease subunit
MSRSRTAGVLWLIAGISTAGIAFFIVDPVTRGAFIIGAVAGLLPAVRASRMPPTVALRTV